MTVCKKKKLRKRKYELKNEHDSQTSGYKIPWRIDMPLQ